MTKEYYIGQIFIEMYPEDVAEWCDNQISPYITIEEIEPLDGVRRFQIVDETPSEEELAQEREKEFNKGFFNTSLGYIRRNVTMANGATRDFLSDLLPTIAMGIQLNQPVTVICYDKPDFTEEVTDWTVFQNEQTVTAKFVQECFMQLSNDFKPVNNEGLDVEN